MHHCCYADCGYTIETVEKIKEFPPTALTGSSGSPYTFLARAELQQHLFSSPLLELFWSRKVMQLTCPP